MPRDHVNKYQEHNRARDLHGVQLYEAKEIESFGPPLPLPFHRAHSIGENRKPQGYRRNVTLAESEPLPEETFEKSDLVENEAQTQTKRWSGQVARSPVLGLAKLGFESHFPTTL